MRTPTRSADADGLLCNLIALTRRREDFVTEVFASLLRANRPTARAYASTLLGRPIAAGTDIRVVTQKGDHAVGCRPDMLVTVGDVRIAVEHKLDAPEGPGQIKKYLANRTGRWDHVTLVSADYCSVAEQVRGHKAYLAPTDGQHHFLWTAFWPLLLKAERAGTANAAAARRLFTELGLQPAHRYIPHLGVADAQQAAIADKKMHAMWEPLRRSLDRRNIHHESSISPRRTSELYISEFATETLQVMWLDPFSSPSSLLIRLRTDTLPRREKIYGRLEARRGTLPAGPLLSIRRENRPTGLNPYAVDVRVPWALVVDRCKNAAAAPKALKNVVLRTMLAATER